MKKFGLAAVILFLVLSTAVIKNTTKQIEDELFTAKENIRVLKITFEFTKKKYHKLKGICENCVSLRIQWFEKAEHFIVSFRMILK